ncbi:MAG: hypothetical protein ABW061_06690, partial [Polyangiaceae bacterium]
MRELRQAAVLSAFACALVLASACGSDGSGGGPVGGGAGAGHAGSAPVGGAPTGDAGAGGMAESSSAGAAGVQGEAGSDDSGGASGSGSRANDGDNAGGAGGAAGDSGAGSGGEAGSVGLVGGEPTYKIVFVTSTRYSGKFGGVAGADVQCQARAVAANLAGVYRAWLSGPDLPSSPSARFAHSSVPYRLLDGSLVADDWGDLTDGTLQHAIDLTELHTKLSFFALTFTLADGTPGLFGSSTTTCYSGNNCN